MFPEPWRSCSTALDQTKPRAPVRRSSLESGDYRGCVRCWEGLKGGESSVFQSNQRRQRERRQPRTPLHEGRPTFICVETERLPKKTCVDSLRQAT